MLKAEFYLNRFYFITEISNYGIFSLRIQKILDKNSKYHIVNRTGDETATTNNYLKYLIEELTNYFNGNKNIIEVDTDFSGYTDREIKIYKYLKNIPSGKIITYSALAKYALNNRANRYVGAALSRNRLQIIIPCHRVVMKNLKIGGFTSQLGVKLKIFLLQNEGIIIKNSKIDNFNVLIL